MTRDAVIVILRAAEAALRAMGVSRAALFGSTARGEARPGSDVDILIELDPAAKLDLYDYVAIQQFVAELFTAPVDVVDRNSLKAHVRPSADRDAVYAF